MARKKHRQPFMRGWVSSGCRARPLISTKFTFMALIFVNETISHKVLILNSWTLVHDIPLVEVGCFDVDKSFR